MSAPPSTHHSAPLIGIQISGAAHKSIENITWADIPELAILTGVNGSGKTQLLELLAYKLTETAHPNYPNITATNVQVTGDNFSPGDVAYIPNAISGFAVGPLSLATLQDAKNNLWNQVQPNNVRNNFRMKALRERLEKYLGVNNLNEIEQQDFVRRLPDDFGFLLDSDDPLAALPHIFLSYRLRVAERLEKGIDRALITKELGPPPWDVLNEVLAAAEFSYRIVSPTESAFLEQYELKFVDAVSGLSLRPNDLSSGEKTIIQVLGWLYSSRHHNRFPRLLLLDEPDAHLHPSMTRQFLEVIKNVLVDHHKVRVILTTHSPSTVALAPEKSIFEMSKAAPRIRPSQSKANTIGLLTSGLVTVAAGTKFVLVEDEADASFYSVVRDILSDQGPTKDPKALHPAPSIVFLPASVGKGAKKVSGGKSVVQGWVAKFDADPLKEIFRGIIDRDTANAPSARVLVLGRYSIENYLLDPITVYGALLASGVAPPVQGVSVSQGNEHLIRSLPRVQLQAIADTITTLVEAVDPALSANPKRAAAYTTGTAIAYPAWVFDHRGHDLLPIFQKAFGGPNVLTPPKLEAAIRRVRMIPDELASIMSSLQS